MSYNHTHVKLASILLAGAMGLIWGSPAQAQNLVTNGDFEMAPFAPSSTLTNWTVGGTGHIHSASEGATNGSHSAAFNIGHNDEGTTLSQSFSTVVGQLYSLDFDSGVVGQPTGTMQMNVQVSGSNNLINQTVTPPAANTSDPNSVVFQHYHFIFVADSTNTTLQFTDVGTGNSVADTLVDSVSVASNILLNPNFENGPFGSPGNVSGWAVGGPASVASLAEGATSPSHSAAFSAGTDSQGNTLSQMVSTASGQLYAIEFDAGSIGNADNQQLMVQALGSGTLLEQMLTPPLSNTFDPNAVVFQHYRFTFTADGSSTTIRFTNFGTGNGATDVLLDTVSLIPTTFAGSGGNSGGDGAAKPSPTPTPTPTATPTPTPVPTATPTPTPTTLPLGNGDFETGPFTTLGTVSSWTVAGNVGDIAEGATTPTHSAALSAGSNSQGDAISQRFFTNPGQIYTLDFDGVI